MNYHWTPYVFVRWVLVYALGILSYIWNPSLVVDYQLCIVSIWILYALGLYYFSKSQKVKYASLLGLGALVLLFFLGAERAQEHKSAFLSDLSLLEDSLVAYSVRIYKPPVKKKRSLQIEAFIYLTHKIEAQKHVWNPKNAKVVLYFPKDTSQNQPKLQYGDELLIRGQPQKIPPPKNPMVFDYQNYMAAKMVYYQDFINHNDYKIIGNRASYQIFAWAYRLRAWAKQQFRQCLKDEQAYALALALTLGIKEALDEEIRTSFAETGLMHILAVSGLHVSLIVWGLGYLFSVLKYLPGGKYLYSLILLVSLGFYVILSGLSPSVMRAVLMFSFLIFADVIGRRQNIYNTLAASAFLLLLINPFFIQSLGFQLSYLALVGILYLQPKIYAFMKTKYQVLNYMGQLSSVSMAAQIATFPLGLYYFHQFPNYFLLSNLFILPLLPLLMSFNFGLLLFAFVPSLRGVFAYLIESLIVIMTQLIQILHKLPYAVSKDIYINAWELSFLYTFIIGILLFFHYRKFFYLKIITLVWLLFWGSIYLRKQHQHQQKFVAIYHLSYHPNLHFVQNNNSIFWADSSLARQEDLIKFQTANFWLAQGIHTSSWSYFHQLRENAQQNFLISYQNKYFLLLVWQKKSFLILKQKPDFQTLEQLTHIHPDYLIVQANALYHQENILQEIDPQFLIMDASNTSYRLKKLAQKAKQLQIPFHNIQSQGAWLIYF